METSTVSPKFQVVIPLRVRQRLGIQPGQKMQVIPFDGHVVLVPMRPIRQSRGLLRGLDTRVEREPDRQ